MKAADVRYLVDAGPLIGWLNANDQWHDWSVQTLRALDEQLWTSEAIFTEACYQLGENTAEVAALVELVCGGQLHVLPTVTDHAVRLRSLLGKYPQIDVCDASLVILSEIFSRAKVVTLDVRDFTVYRRFRSEALPLIAPGIV